MSFIVKATIIGSSDAYTPVCYGLSNDIGKITFKINGTSVDIIDVPNDEQYSWFSLELTQGETVTVEVSGSSEDLITFKRNNYLQSIIIQSATIIPELWVYHCEILQSVSILEGVTSIGKSAFAECPILSGEIIIPDSVTSTDTSVFTRCPGITSVTLGSGLTDIAYYMFSECTGLTNIIIPYNVRTIGTYSFQNCESLTNIDIPGNVYFIGEGAFSRCTGLTNVFIPDSVQTGYEYIFDGCTNLTSVTIGSKMRSIGFGIFRDCSNLSSVTVSSNNPYYDSRGNCNAIIETSSNTLIAGCKNTVIPDDVTTIYTMAFNGSGITSVTIPDSVITIEDYAFDACSNMTNITIGSGLTSIGEYAFRDCIGLTSIVVSSNNTSYDSRNNCNCIIETATNEILIGSNNSFIPNSITSIGKYAFKYCPNLTGKLVIPNGVTAIKYEAFNGCSNLTGNLIIPNSVTSIGVRAFQNCTGLTGELIIPDSVTEIGGSAFDNCTGLTSVVIGSGVTNADGFYGCTGLTSVTIGPNVTTIDLFAFSNCTGLTSIVIPNSVTSINQSAFLHCTNLSDLTIGSGVTTIGPYAFGGCTGLNTITSYAITAPTLDRYAFYDIKSNGVLLYPEGSNYSSWLRTISFYLGYYNWTGGSGEHLILDAPVEGGTFTVDIEAPAADWTVVKKPNWTSVENGTITVNSNFDDSTRYGEIVIYTTDNVYVVTITQSNLELWWDYAPMTTLKNSGGFWYGVLNYNLKPDEVIVTAEGWLNEQWAINDTFLYVYGNVDPVGGKVDRIGQIDVTLKYLTNNGDTTSINTSNTVIQNGEDVTFYPEVASVAPEGGLVTTTVTSNYPLNGYKSAISSVADVTFERVSDTEIKIYASYPAAKQGVTDVITLVGDYGFDNIPVTTVSQAKFVYTWEINPYNTFFSTDSTPEAQYVDYVFGIVGYDSSIDITDMTFTVEYINGTDWVNTITNDTEWKEIVIQLKDNRLGDSRLAKITAYSQQLDTSREFEIHQQGLQMYIRPTSTSIGSSGGTVTFGVNDAMAGWIGPNDISITLDGQNVPFTSQFHSRTLEVSIEVPVNESDTNRTLYYTIRANSDSLHFVVNQAGFEWDIVESMWIDSTATTPTDQTAVLTDQITYTSLEDLGTLDITSDVDWITVTGQSWNNGTGTVNFTAGDNRLGRTRSAVMTLYSSRFNKTKQVTITQRGVYLEIYDYPREIECSGDYFSIRVFADSWLSQDEINIKANVDGQWVDLPFEVEGGYIVNDSNPVWIEYMYDNLYGPRQVEFKIEVPSANTSYPFSVTQQSCYMSIDTTPIVFEQRGGSREIYVEADADWSVYTPNDWITLSTNDGDGDDIVTITVSENNSHYERTGYVEFRARFITIRVPIIQGYIIPELRFKERYVKMPLEGGTTYVTLISNIDWTTEWEIQ